VAFNEVEKAEVLVKGLNKSSKNNVVIKNEVVEDKSVFKVRIGPLMNDKEVGAILAKLKSDGYDGAFRVTE